MPEIRLSIHKLNGLIFWRWNGDKRFWPHGLEVSLEPGHSQQRKQGEGDKIQQGWLRCLKYLKIICYEELYFNFTKRINRVKYSGDFLKFWLWCINQYNCNFQNRLFFCNWECTQIYRPLSYPLRSLTPNKNKLPRLIL